jgi:hypothetical protein
MAGSHGKRPETKFKVMAKLGENLYKTTKIYREKHTAETQMAGFPGEHSRASRNVA